MSIYVCMYFSICIYISQMKAVSVRLGYLSCYGRELPAMAHKMSLKCSMSRFNLILDRVYKM